MSRRPKVLVSACLLGERVRHDGQHKQNNWIKDELSRWVDLEALCPEMAMGLGTPRETISLHLVSGKVKLISNKNKVDLTEAANVVSQKLLDVSERWDGAILKKDSPSCGIERVRLYRSTGIPDRDGVGMFARALQIKHPFLPMIHEGRLTDLLQREAFVLKIFALHRLKSIARKTSSLQKFHQNYKLILMSHSPHLTQRLGQIASGTLKEKFDTVYDRYITLFLECIHTPTTPQRRVNVLEHMMGYFKKQLSSGEKKKLNQQIQDYRSGVVPLLVPLELIRYLVDRFQVDYLQDQLFFEPYPKELKLMRFL